ncbi:glycerophosphodiester phosphodiesterase [Dyadobacter aurulentus]|uniref:glycerophosphodiester phosphodiesterase n=1 Tax=Dyadobacter sp. UC 10 TaxID=2605428 RepID=UPI001788D452|nr:glycerophosphodiester phosphodiesterase family protein [Dyadobacter sp. UC 10]
MKKPTSAANRYVFQHLLKYMPVLAFLLLSELVASAQAVRLIAHRGGVVDSTYTENSLPALMQAAKEGYAMIETDVRVTKDGQLIANHDADFKRFYGLDKRVVDMEWSDVKKLKSTLDGGSPVLLEDVFRFCREHQMGVMLDNKIRGMDVKLFEKLIALVEKYQLRESALMIGTDESTDFFTGKIRLSCSRKQLEENMQKTGYKSENYFFFERPANLSVGDVKWAKSLGIVTIAAINTYHYRDSKDALSDAREDCKRMLGFGVTTFQIDSEYRKFLVN